MTISKCPHNENWVSGNEALLSIAKSYELALEHVSALENKLQIACENGDVKAKRKDGMPINLRALLHELLIEFDSLRMWAERLEGIENGSRAWVKRRNQAGLRSQRAVKDGPAPPDAELPQYKRKINNLIKTVFVLVDIILKKLTGMPFKDAEAIFQEVDLQGKNLPIGKQTLGNYLKEGYALAN